MMKEENDITSGGGGGGSDVENSIPVKQGVIADDDNNPYKTKQSNKKPKVIALSLFLLCAVILSIALGTTLNNSSTSSANEVEGTNNGGDTLGEDEPIVDVIPTSTDENNNEDTTPTIPTIYKAQYLDNNGPIISKVRIIDSSVANGYDSCIDLRDDIENALKHYANNLIVRESKNDYYEKCDPNNPNWGNSYWWGTEDGVMAVAFDGAAPVPEMAMAEESTADKAPVSAGDSAALSGEGGIKEDSYETNNQV